MMKSIKSGELMLKDFDTREPFGIRDNLLQLQEVRQSIVDVMFDDQPSSSLGRELPAKVILLEFQEQPWKAYAEKRFSTREMQFTGDFSAMHSASSE